MKLYGACRLAVRTLGCGLSNESSILSLHPREGDYVSYNVGVVWCRYFYFSGVIWVEDTPAEMVGVLLDPSIFPFDPESYIWLN